MGATKSVFIEHFGDGQDGSDLRGVLAAAMRWVDIESIVKPGARVFLKPNLTWKVPTPGVTTSPQAIRAVVEYLRGITPHITVGESNGGQDCFWAEDALRSHGVYDLSDEFGIRVVNLSKEPVEKRATTIGGKLIEVELPSMLLGDVDTFITIPVPKIHAMTRVSIAFKNQWGCLGNSMRVTEHPRFPELVVAINKLLRPQLAICDGTYFLDRTGPMMGEPVAMNLLVVSNDIGAASMACCEIMQLDHRRVKHLQVARAEGMLPASLDELRFNRRPAEFRRRQYRLERAMINYIHLIAFRNRWANRLFYNSSFADALHQILWFVRRNAFVDRLLYGRFGHGQADRHGAY